MLSTGSAGLRQTLEQRILVVDRHRYGSDTLSTHAVMRGAVRRNRTTFSYGAESLTLDVRPEPEAEGLAAPRRTVRDRALVDAAIETGAEVLHNTKMNGLVFDTDGGVKRHRPHPG